MTQSDPTRAHDDVADQPISTNYDPMNAEVGGDRLRQFNSVPEAVKAIGPHDVLKGRNPMDVRRELVANAGDAFTLDDVKSVWPEDTGPGVRHAFTPELMVQVLNNIARMGVCYQACRASAISVSTIKRMRKAFPIVEDLIQCAYDVYRERIAEAIHERAILGVDEPQFYKGDVCGHITRYSDRLLELLAKRHIPEFRDHMTTDLNVKGGVLAIAAPTVSREEYLAQRRKADAIDGEVVDAKSTDSSTGGDAGGKPVPGPSAG